ncbi:MAG: ATP-binding protein [Pyrinomonadaceae bacterium]
MAEPGFVKKDPSRRLAEINRAITTSLNFDEVLNLIVRNAAQLVDANVSVLLLVDQHGQLRIRAAHGIDSDLAKEFNGRMEEDVVRQLRTALPLTAEEVLVSVPVIAKQSLNGLLVIARQRPLDADEQWQLSALADQAAIALRNARLYEMELAEATRERDETVEALRESKQKIVTMLAREQQARADAEEANRLKDEFLATLSHELRNPLNVVIGYAEILRRSDESQPHSFVVKAADTIRRNALAQAQLVSDLLDLSRLQMGKLALNQQPVSLSTIITDAVETVRTEAKAKRITLNIDLDPEILVIEGDPVRLGQVAWNLLNNAVKFTPVDGNVKVALTRDGEDALLTIEDNGQGISPEFLPHVFEIFRQADASSARRQGGMGIGLALVKQLAELHGGRVSAESQGVGAGARFSVWIPLYKAGVAGIASEPTGATRALERKFILVVDDSAETTDMLGRLLQLEGAFVESARSGAEALEIARRENFDLVVSDISMPEMDGYQLLQKLRELPSMANVPAVALTGYGRGADIERALAEGFAEHLTKPLDLDQLLQIVRRLTDEKTTPGK